jgi:hypothetical protein
LSGGVLDWFVTRQNLPRISLILAGAAVALALALLVFQILTDIQERLPSDAGSVASVAADCGVEPPHSHCPPVHRLPHVAERNERAIQQVNAEVVRIESVLREVSVALGEHADFPTAIVPIARRNG